MISGSLFFYQNWLTFLLALWLSFFIDKGKNQPVNVKTAPVFVQIRLQNRGFSALVDSVDTGNEILYSFAGNGWKDSHWIRKNDGT